MQTKLIQARHLSIANAIVDGGDGVRRTTHPINELHIDPAKVVAVVRKGEGFDRRELDPKQSVRVLV
jgi:hypothetical protein